MASITTSMSPAPSKTKWQPGRVFEELDLIYLPSTGGEAVEVLRPGPQRIAVYERTRPDRAASIVGRRDF